MFEILLIMTATTVVFLFGINTGYRLRKGEKPVVIPKTEEIKKSIPITKEYKKEKKANEETKRNQEKIERLNKIMTNIGIYDGTSDGQMEVK